MMLTTLMLSATALIELGTSPLVDPGHQHDWVEIPDQAEDELALHDRNWAQTMRYRGRTLKLVLTRTDLTDDGEKVIMDLILAADCRARQVGMSKVYLHKSPLGDGLELKLDNIELDLIADPPRKDDLAILATACG